MLNHIKNKLIASIILISIIMIHSNSYSQCVITRPGSEVEKQEEVKTLKGDKNNQSDKDIEIKSMLKSLNKFKYFSLEDKEDITDKLFDDKYCRNRDILQKLIQTLKDEPDPIAQQFIMQPLFYLSQKDDFGKDVEKWEDWFKINRDILQK